MIVVLAVPAIAVDLPCVDCHPKEVQGYRQSAMAHSLSEVTGQPDSLRDQIFHSLESIGHAAEV
jgi:hypothetical protein